jgi:cobalt-zinc-cadmium efflux system outer membrane protein
MNVFRCVTCAIAVGVVLSGCASVPEDRGAAVATDLLKTRSALAASVPIAVNSRSGAADMLANPLTADDAVRLALLQNPRMRELYSELGFAQAEIYDATRLSNPVLAYSRLTGGGHAQVTWSVSQSFTDLLFIGFRTRIGRSQLLQTQQHVASAVLELEAKVRSQYYRAVSSDLVAEMRARAAQTAQLSAQYAQRLYDAGNISALPLSREQAAAGTAEIVRRWAANDALAQRSQLFSLLGLSMTESSAMLHRELPLPAAFSTDIAHLQAWALANRLDLAAARELVAMSSANATHSRRWRWLGGIDVGYEKERDIADEAIQGPTASLELPLFNQGNGRLLRARSALERADATVASLELGIANDLVVRRDALQSAAANVQQYRDSLVPLHERIVELTQQEHNFMLVGAFELLAAKQQEYDTYQSYVESVRDYWIAHAELLRTAGGHLPGDAKSPGAVGVDARPAEDTAARDATAPGDHQEHHAPDAASSSGEAP